jgi:hypothetical protein
VRGPHPRRRRDVPRRFRQRHDHGLDAPRREIVYDIQRYLSQQVYYLYPSPSAKVVGAWEPHVKNYMPNISLDYGGRLMAAWLDKS